MVKYIVKNEKDMENVGTDVSEIEFVYNCEILPLIKEWKYKKYITILNLFGGGDYRMSSRYSHFSNIVIKLYSYYDMMNHKNYINRSDIMYEFHHKSGSKNEYFDNISGMISLETYRLYPKVGLEVRNKMLDRYERYYFNHNPLLKFDDYDLIFMYN